MDNSLNMGDAQPGLKDATRTSTDENFPVASRLIPAALRPHVHLFYLCVRAADDVADDGDMEPERKMQLLTEMDEALQGNQPRNGITAYALDHRASTEETGVSIDHARHVLQAFMMDVTKLRYRNWSELINYCLFSAAPVGRFLLDLHGDPVTAKTHTDALCNALQILNHLQDCKDDYQALDRVYIPTDYLRDQGIDVTALEAERCSPQLRAVLDQVLDRTDELIVRARPGPGKIKNLGLKLETAIIITIAEKLSARLRRHDPLAERVELSGFQKAMAVLQGICWGLVAR
ncbi:MAG: squalene/phytoene synthase family protein [Rhodospirillaceae bacterium]|jgi:hydroxysqualene synthase|nr:squalene/phytoene synthase family protein [Rhodospirillaceae bacterium]MBT5456181.1 squalene/phytoene synthase family protein [Rhodospirillaceae bacterium]